MFLVPYMLGDAQCEFEDANMTDSERVRVMPAIKIVSNLGESFVKKS